LTPPEDAAANAIRLTVQPPAPGDIIAGAPAFIDVTISNHAATDLTWTPQAPVNLAYHWIDPASGAVIEYNGRRTVLGQPIRAGEHRRVLATVETPPAAGPALLRVCLVREGEYWFDSAAPASAADITLDVQPPEAWQPAAPGSYAPHPALNQRALDRFIRHRGKPRPLMLICETVNICNNHCIICAYDSQTRKKQTMPMPVFEEVIRQYAAIGGGMLSLTPVVGDVFLDKLLPERLRLIEARRDVITGLSVTTNAVFVKRYDDGELAALLSHFDPLTISIYGIDPEEHAAMTKRPDYADTRTALARIFRLSRHRIAIGFRSLKQRSAAELQDWLAAIPHYDQVQGRITVTGDARAFANWGILDTTKPLPFGATWLPLQPDRHSQCGIPLIAMQVFADGNVSFCPCDDFDNHASLHLGNVMTATLAEMAGSPRAQALWDWATHGTPAFCRSCSFHTPLAAITATPGIFEDPLVLAGG
jgi:radical SAM protein with 4Fe4S-binding SPASM domain